MKQIWFISIYGVEYFSPNGQSANMFHLWPWDICFQKIYVCKNPRHGAGLPYTGLQPNTFGLADRVFDPLLNGIVLPAWAGSERLQDSD